MDKEYYVGSRWEFKKGYKTAETSGMIMEVTRIEFGHDELLFSKENRFFLSNNLDSNEDVLDGRSMLKFLELKDFSDKSNLTEHEKGELDKFLDNLFFENAIDIVLKNHDEEGFKKLTQKDDK